jgi:PqqD family protein of HPr-rel-A system
MKWQFHSVGRFYDANESTVVYFDSRSGDTHLLSDFAAFVLQQFGASPLTTESILQKLSLAIEFPEDEDLEQMVVGVLEELVSLDILKRA